MLLAAQLLQDGPNSNSDTPDFSVPPEDSHLSWSRDESVDEDLVFAGDLNASQVCALRDMLNFTKDVSVIQGPPGTGKTHVIAAYIAQILSQPGGTCLVVAQSNVAIKNVGEKLYNSGIHDWTLIVSSEFLAGW